MRLIDGDALMKDLVDAIASQRRWMDSAKKGNSGTLFQLAQQAYLTLLECKQRLEKAPTAGWIPVTEKLPEQPGLYLCTCRIYEGWDVLELCYGNHIAPGADKHFMLANGFAFGEHWSNGLDNLAEVTAWQPIPSPYEEG